METQETKEALSPLQELRQDTRELQIGYEWLKWNQKFTATIIFAVMLAGFTGLAGLMTYLHGDTKQDMQKLESRLDSRIDKLDSRIDKIDSKLDLLIQSLQARPRRR